MANAILSFHFLLTIPLAGLPLLKNFHIKRLLARWSSRKNRTTSRTTTPSCCSLSRTWDGNVVDVVGEGRRRATRWWEIVLLLNILMQVKKPTAFYSAEPWHGPHGEPWYECGVHNAYQNVLPPWRPGEALYAISDNWHFILLSLSRFRLVSFASSLSSVPKSSFSIYLTTIRKLLCFVGIFK